MYASTHELHHRMVLANGVYILPSGADDEVQSLSNSTMFALNHEAFIIKPLS